MPPFPYRLAKHRALGAVVAAWAVGAVGAVVAAVVAAWAMCVLLSRCFGEQVTR